MLGIGRLPLSQFTYLIQFQPKSNQIMDAYKRVVHRTRELEEAESRLYQVIT